MIDVAVIGAGYSGTLTAIQLRRALPPDIGVELVEHGRFAQGPAYRVDAPPFMLNVRSDNMSAFPDDPGHFHRWLTGNPGHVSEWVETDAGVFATRRLYGRYLGMLLDETGGIRRRQAHVSAIRRGECGYAVACEGGPLVARAVVLAVGGVAAERPREGVVFHDPWSPATTADLRAGTPVLVLGSSLTMVDLVLDMHAHGFGGPIIALSRRGLVPLRHRGSEAARQLPEVADWPTHSLAAMLHRLRAEARAETAAGGGWRAVIEGMRPVTIPLWQALPVSEKARFLRHLTAWWGIHRHRLAAPVADAFDALRRSGVVQVMRGRMRGVVPEADGARVTVDGRDGRREIFVQRAIVATGFSSAARADGLIGQLRDDGLCRPDVLGLGLETTGDLAVIGGDGRVQPGLFALGPLVRGMFWECTAVPNIRAQTVQVAQAVALHLGCGIA